jgi:hypothetical protein
MKLKNLAIVSAALAGSLWNLAASAQFTYNPGDLFVGFRTAGGSTDLLVDIGAPGAINTSAINGALLNSVFGGLDGIYWSVFGYQTPQNNLFTTSARSDITQQTDPTSSSGFNGQGIVIGHMRGILNGAVASGTALSSSVVEISSSLNQGVNTSYSVGVVTLLGANHAGDFRGSWSPVENFTGSGFAGGGMPSVSDLYFNAPGNPLTTIGAYQGDFSLGTDGSLTFVVPEPGTGLMLGAGVLVLLAVRRIRDRNEA